MGLRTFHPSHPKWAKHPHPTKQLNNVHAHIYIYTHLYAQSSLINDNWATMQNQHLRSQPCCHHHRASRLIKPLRHKPIFGSAHGQLPQASATSPKLHEHRGWFRPGHSAAVVVVVNGPVGCGQMDFSGRVETTQQDTSPFSTSQQSKLCSLCGVLSVNKTQGMSGKRFALQGFNKHMQNCPCSQNL